METNESVVRRYVCARCWGRLLLVHSDHKDRIVCARANTGECDGEGYVTANYASRRRSESYAELLEVRENFYYLLSRGKPKLTEKEILASLGF